MGEPEGYYSGVPYYPMTQPMPQNTYYSSPPNAQQVQQMQMQQMGNGMPQQHMQAGPPPGYGAPQYPTGYYPPPPYQQPINMQHQHQGMYIESSGPIPVIQLSPLSEYFLLFIWFYVQIATYDAGARFGGKGGGSISIPPPPPGYAPTAAQLASMNGQTVNYSIATLV